MQLNVTAFSANSNNAITANGTSSNNFFLGNNDLFLPFSQNVLVKKIRFNFRSNVSTNNNFPKYWSARVNAINKDGLNLIGQQGEILNATSGVFNQFPIKTNVLRFNVNKDFPELSWKDGILIGGLSLNTMSYEFYNTNPISGTNKLFFNIIVLWQFPK